MIRLRVGPPGPRSVVLAEGRPDDDGVAVAAEIVRRAPCAIVRLTSHAGTDLGRRARAAGAMAYPPKPPRAAALERPSSREALTRRGPAATRASGRRPAPAGAR